jgi:1-acyl-sn-glycerol-3-phosphate acyltransferase
MTPAATHEVRPRGPSPRLRGASWHDSARLLGWGRWLLRSRLHALAALPEDAPRVQVAQAQRDAARCLLQHLRVRLHICGEQHLPAAPGLLIAMHEGLADALCLATLPLPLRFVARREVFDWAGIGPALQRCRHIAIEPEAGDRAYRTLLRDTGAALAAGDHVVVFPQGCLLGIQTAFLPGAFHLARRLDVAILPVVITGSHRIWEHPFSDRLRYGQAVGLQILPPVGIDEIRATAPDTLRLRLQARMKRIALSPALPAPRHYVPERDGTWPDFRFEIDPDWRQARDPAPLRSPSRRRTGSTARP